MRGKKGFKRTWWGGLRFDEQAWLAEGEQYEAVRRDGRDEVTKYFDGRELTAFAHVAQRAGVQPAPPFIEVLAAVALVPFVSAVASTLGTRLSSSIEEAVVTILQRVPRPAVLHIGRRLREPEPEASPREEVSTASAPLIVTADGGARIQISSSTPVEALAILVGIDFSELADLGDVPATVRWIGSQWNAASVQDGTIIDVTWDPETRAWQRYFQF